MLAPHRHKLLTPVASVSSWLVVRRSLDSNALSDRNVSFIKATLESAPRTPTTVLDLPSRLIYIRKAPETGDFALRLLLKSEVLEMYQSQGSTREIKYAALSYCWGSAEDARRQMKTTVSSFERLRIEMPFKELAAATRDAVEVCIALGISYLWVDALCIIQDNAEDWQRESTRMKAVYAGAYVTICAAFTKSCHESFIQIGRPFARLNFASSLRPSIRGTIYLEPSGGVQVDHGMNMNPWRTRGWTFQEGHMSRRMVVFGKSRVYAAIDGLWTDETGFSERLPPPFFSAMESMTELELRELWGRDVMGVLCERNFTVDSDRLPALSGLAELANTLLRDDYLAGCWRSHFLPQLMWSWGSNLPSDYGGGIFGAGLEELESHYGTPQNPPSYVASSWSWVRLRGIAREGLAGHAIRHFRQRYLSETATSRD